MTTPEYPYPEDGFGQQPPAYQPPPGYPPPPGYAQPGYPPPPGWPMAGAYGGALSDRSKLTAGLLGLFFGSLGVGRFYLGYTGVGVAQIAVTWLTCGIGGLWPLIDAIMILTGKVPDAQGRPLRD
jgi:TM2 domain-containing membrane protein YozV